MARKFAARPNLNENFVQCNEAEVNRIFAVLDPTLDKMYSFIHNHVKVKRKLPYFGVPTL